MKRRHLWFGVLVWLAYSAFDIGVNAVCHPGQPGEVLQFIAGWAVTTVLAVAVSAYVLSCREKNPHKNTPESSRK
jgi:hypothetical protein